MIAVSSAIPERAAPLHVRIPDDEWVLTVPSDDPWRASLAGAPFSERGRWRVFFQGILYEPGDLAAALGLSKRTSNQDLVLAACERWGTAAIRRLRGIFVVAVIDRATGMAIVARDPLGMHPLFYAQVGQTFSFSTEPRFLFARTGISCTPNRAMLADHLCFRWLVAEETFFENVRRVRPGWQAVVAREGFRVERHWDPQGSDARAEFLTDKEADQFDDRLGASVERCLSLGKPGIFLSGGLDSISIATVLADRAREAGQEPPLALSIGFPDPLCDERSIQRAVANQLGLPHRLIDFHDAVGPRGLLAPMLELSCDLISPVLNTWAPAYLALAQAGRAEGVDAILSGQGGDEWLTVSPFISADMIRRGNLTGLLKFARSWWTSYRQPLPYVLRGVLWTFGLRPLASQALHRMAPSKWDDSRTRRALAADPRWVAPDASLREQQLLRLRPNLTPADPPRGFYDREERLGLNMPMVSWEMEEQYQFGRRVGAAFVHPYWDADLLEMLLRMPIQRLLKGGRSKGLVREAVGRRLPNLGLERQKKFGATEFFQSIVRSEGPALSKSVGDLDALIGLRVVHPDWARLNREDVSVNEDRRAFRALHLMKLETWVRPYVR